MRTFLTRSLPVCLLVVTILGGCANNERRVVPVLYEIPDVQNQFNFKQASLQRTALTVVTLNVAHGRGNGIHQLFQSADRHQRNLDGISAVLRRERPHVVALQEADGPSAWSGGFSHVAYLARTAGFAYYVRGQHDFFPGLSYGTAILSRLRLRDSLAVTFRLATPAFRKGFVISSLSWPGRPDMEVDIVSVHLDFINARVRERQIAQLMEVLETRTRPLVLMGDFNSVWNGRKKLLQKLIDEFALSTYEPESEGFVSHPLLGRRLDWVFVSRELLIETYETLPDVVSDHRAVKARILVRPVSPRQAAFRW